MRADLCEPIHPPVVVGGHVVDLIPRYCVFQYSEEEDADDKDDDVDRARVAANRISPSKPGLAKIVDGKVSASTD